MKRSIFFLLLWLTGLFITEVGAQTFNKAEGIAAPAAEPAGSSKARVNNAVSGNLIEGFENYDDFSLEFPPWTLLDLDGGHTWGIDGVQFKNQYAPMSFIIFNPSATVPPMTNPAIAPYQGFKFAACFASNGVKNNDWLISPPLEAGTNTSVSFRVKSYTSQYGLERYRVAVSTTGTNPADFTYISGINYLTAPAGEWEKKTFDLNAYNGKTIHIAIQCVSDNAFIFMVDDFVYSTMLPEITRITGLVTDALDGKPVAGAMVSIAGLSTVTDENGNYTLNDIPEGELRAGFTADITQGIAPMTVSFNDLSSENNYILTCEKDGYITYENDQVVIPKGEKLEMNISLSRNLPEGAMRFVLNWGPYPADLDSHLNTPEIEGEAYHIYYHNKGSSTSAPYATLDYDVTTGYGPETMTIYQLFNGTYRYYIHNYSETPAITSSHAVLQIYSYDSLVKTIQIPPTGMGHYWYVCDINGATGQVNVVNRIQNAPPGGFRFELPAKKSASGTTSRNILSWHWDFGDGATSEQQNPAHTFSAPGNYTITLTVSNGSEIAIETKPAYIRAGSLGIAENALSRRIKVYPVPADTHIVIDSPEPIQTVRILDMAGNETAAIKDNHFKTTLNLGFLKSGNYLLIIETEKGTATKKISVN